MPRGNDISPNVTWDKLQLGWLHRDLTIVRAATDRLSLRELEFVTKVSQGIADRADLGLLPIMTQKQFQWLKSIATEVVSR